MVSPLTTLIISRSNKLMDRLGDPIDHEDKLTPLGKVLVVSAIFDAAAVLTGIVMGILGILGTVVMPAAAAYSLIALSSVMIAGWVAMSLVYKDNYIPLYKQLFSSAFGCLPKADAQPIEI